MLRILGSQAHQVCDRVTRRCFLQVGGLGLGGLSLPQLLQAEARAGSRSSHKSVIMIFLSGGPPHQDMVDLKPLAPAEIRGEFRPIATSVPGIQICEHLPKIARLTERLAILRAVVGSEGRHAAPSSARLAGPSMASRRAAGHRSARWSASSRGRLPRRCRRLLAWHRR
jgi:hypothetical protein